MIITGDHGMVKIFGCIEIPVNTQLFTVTSKIDMLWHIFPKEGIAASVSVIAEK